MPRTDDTFIASLTPDQRQIFKDLQELLKERSPPLSCRYRIGQCVVAWRQVVRLNKPGTFARLAGHLGTSPTQLVKAARFALGAQSFLCLTCHTAAGSVTPNPSAVLAGAPVHGT